MVSSRTKTALRCACITLVLIFSWFCVTDYTIIEHGPLPASAVATVVVPSTDTVVHTVSITKKPKKHLHKTIKPAVVCVDTVHVIAATDTIPAVPINDTIVPTTSADIDTFCFECVAEVESAASTKDTISIVPSDTTARTSQSRDTLTSSPTDETYVDDTLADIAHAMTDTDATSTASVPTTDGDVAPKIRPIEQPNVAVDSVVKDSVATSTPKPVSKKVSKPVPHTTRVSKTSRPVSFTPIHFKNFYVDPVVTGMKFKDANKKYVKILRQSTKHLDFNSDEAKFIRHYNAKKFLDSPSDSINNTFLVRLQRHMNKAAKLDKNKIPPDFTISQYLQRLCAEQAMRKTRHKQIKLQS